MPRLRALVRVVFAFVLVGMPAALLAKEAMAQVPNPARQAGLHGMIANPAPGLTVSSSPHFAAPDGIWNHGEGFAPPGVPDADYGGWHNVDDGRHVTSGDVHPAAGTWVSFAWSDPFHPSAPAPMERFEGWLRPAGLPLPTAHPLYGALGTTGGVPNTYVDQGAFELFRPLSGPSSPTQKILICIECWQSVGFPLDRDNKSPGWSQLYTGFFSPDGLTRREPENQPRTAATFLGNNDDGAVVRRPLLNIVASWQTNQSYWPVVGYPVLSVMHRQTTLNEQRYLQLVQAIKSLLQENSARNPLGPGNALLPDEVERRVVVGFTGGSNGGLNAELAALVHPERVHGAYAVAIHPSLQRFHGEHELGHALSRLSGGRYIGAGIGLPDFLHWNQYPWSFGVELHDLSYLRHFVKGTSYRPACFLVGDEDITSTGTDWTRVASGANWTDNA